MSKHSEAPKPRADPVAALIAAMRGPARHDEFTNGEEFVTGFVAIVGSDHQSGPRVARRARRLTGRTGIAVLAITFASAGAAAAGNRLLPMPFPVPFVDERSSTPVDDQPDGPRLIIDATGSGSTGTNPSTDAAPADSSNPDDTIVGEPNEPKAPTTSVVAATVIVMPAQPVSATTPTTTPTETPAPNPSTIAPGQDATGNGNNAGDNGSTKGAPP